MASADGGGAAINLRERASMSTERQKQIWIGLVGVRTLPSSELLREATGDYVNVLTWASDEAEFRNKAAELMDSLKLFLVAIENPGPLSDRGSAANREESISELAAMVRENPVAIIYGTFHTWTEKDM